MRSKYIGVYRNVTPYDTKRYRVAIRTYKDGDTKYTDVGKFNNEITAAWIYNIYAVKTFGTRAVINNVDPDLMDVQEYDRFAEYHTEFRDIEQDVLDILDNNITDFRTNEDFHG